MTTPQRAPTKQLYGRRKGWKLSPHQSGLVDTMLPALALTLQPGRDPKAYFDTFVDDVWLEIGFGGGEHLFWQANKNPSVGIIGAEPFIAGMAKLLSKVDAANIANVRLYSDDARDILATLPDGSLGRVFILFPDPWPKTRHHKRRFIQMDMLDELARVLRPGAELRCATDHPGYCDYALERFMAHRAFSWMAKRAGDWKMRPADWPPTRYEAKAIAVQRPCAYLSFIRV